MKPIVVPIFMPNGNFVFATIENYSKVGEIKSQVMKKLKFTKNKIPFFCLYEVCKKSGKIGKQKENILINI